ncbi:hypothetical protein LIER_24897 [Lithospermum erythrorhizon]|uniref:Uncharacterized protein n=1 Tax=Lithospermum erythrorhizon TaxID=34254 RepID=A0AAV3R2N5_LITER
MMRYHGKGKGKVYALSEARTVLRSCLVTWKATRTDGEQPFFYDDHLSQSPPDRAFFLSVRTGRVCNRVGSESTREMVDLATSLKFWGSCVLSKARHTVIFPCNTSPHSPHVNYKTWLNNLFPSKAPRSTFMKYKKGKGLLAGVHPSTLVFQSSGSSKRRAPLAALWKIGIQSMLEVVEVSFSISDQVHTELVDTGESPECLPTEVAKSCPPALPTVTITQRVAAILRTWVSSLWSCIYTGSKGSLLRW